MNKEQIIKKIEEALKKMGCTEISFDDSNSELIIATFNCKELTSFVANIPNWTYSGTILDPTNERQYRIDFKKIN
ncbi:MAG: hypothetical protein A2431_00445 [Candidatus Zambryskibacteria bacterium RIFOXYC1_FULL_39_10]|uniref:Uncharacterized protein n=1 Tax=Candidatus Zambryskibacteria bacterium RIFOXYC1_FULL_39_10 TaxID=1802779 RepID=A0A1G2UZ44_9BACT|nr:MAG: hypothetical protein A2431_00445 [Candidatus Zambryskibacteria bacterium RIFOXYC1_FULL_39_10]OHB15614.1 MAG: hypothetical protein A2605_02305 [Candidatus Zambryskibacteria bacterium RIFOXYD1_FULL_39_35]